MVDTGENNYSNSDNIEELITDFLNGHMSDEVRLAFEERLSKDSALRDKVNFHKELAAAVRQLERDELRERLKKLRNSKMYELEWDELRPTASAKVKEVISVYDTNGIHKLKRRNYFTIAAIITIILVSSAVIYFQLTQRNSNDNNMSQVTKPNDPGSTNTAPYSNPTISHNLDSNKIIKPEENYVANSNVVNEFNLNVNSFPITLTIGETGFGPEASYKLKLTLYNSKNNIYSYLFRENKLVLYVGNQKEIRVYHLSAIDAEEATIKNEILESKINPGYYLFLDGNLYLLDNDSLEHPLIPLEIKIKDYLMNLNP